MVTSYDIDWLKLFDSAIQNGAALSKDSFDFFDTGLLLTKLTLQNASDHGNGNGTNGTISGLAVMTAKIRCSPESMSALCFHHL